MCLTCSLPVSIKNEYDILGEKYSECHEILHVSAVIPVIGTAKAVKACGVWGRERRRRPFLIFQSHYPPTVVSGFFKGFSTVFGENLFCFNCFEYSNKKSTEDKGVFQGELNTNVV